MQRYIRHGCFLLTIMALRVGLADAQGPVPVQSRTFDLEYEVNEDALPLTSVFLWYTLDRGDTWIEFGADSDRQPPITFEATHEGMYGFFLVVANASGASSATPRRGTEPHRWAYVDFTPPVVQLHPVRQTTSVGRRALQIRWTAIDAHFGARPVEVAYQRRPDTTWHSATPEPIANTGRYDWVLPEIVHGPIALRVTVRDAGDHTVHSATEVLDVTDETLTSMPVPATASLASDTPVATVASPVLQRAELLFGEAMAFRDQGEYRKGISRLREAVRLNPEWTEAFSEMADMLYRLGDSDRALGAYQLALRQDPTLRSALRGSAKVYRRKNDHAAAARALRTVLGDRPDDAETWMSLGDVAVFQGDELLAWECYTRATQVDPKAVEVIADARKRLNVMASVSRTYRPEGS